MHLQEIVLRVGQCLFRMVYLAIEKVMKYFKGSLGKGGIPDNSIMLELIIGLFLLKTLQANHALKMLDVLFGKDT